MHRVPLVRLRLIVLCLLLCLSFFGTTAAADACVNDPDALFDRYVESLFQKDLLTARSIAPAGSRLTGASANAYRLLLPEIQNVAAGECEETVFEFPLSSVLEKATLTAEDLGVDKLFDGNDLTAAAQIKLNSYARSVNLSKVHEALMFDLPYELYWYDITAGMNYTANYRYTRGAYGKSVRLSGSCTFSMAVASAYQKNQRKYCFDGERARLAKAAADNAKQIIRASAALKDREKLQAYKDAICTRVTYNYAVAGAKSSVSYGDPWQLVWVFDEDPDTNVVCEGYAKAFKYLCDASTFAGDISVITVRGYLNGAHMWNTVNVDGSNYLVDVTNCDTGTVGYPDGLFMVKALSGTVESGYVFAAGTESRQLTYTYDAHTISGYDREDLTYALASSDALVLPQGLTSVANEAFCGAEKLIRVVLPESCRSIAGKAFAECPRLVGITIPNGDCSIADDAFENSGLEYICTEADSSVFAWGALHGYTMIALP